ncbi:MAG: SMC-Scp complex subunit ScpB [Thermodesulfobacteriota bacterium]
MSQDLKRILEALLFAAESPLSLAQLCSVLETKEQASVQQALIELQQEYQQMERSFELVTVAGGWSLRTRAEHAYWLRRLRRQQVTRLSQAALETLAIVAYKQPVLKAEIEHIRGVEVGGILRMLMEKGLIKVAGRKDLPGRPLVYATTKRFLEVFDLKDLKDLPTVEEMESLAEGDQTMAEKAPTLPLADPRPTLEDMAELAMEPPPQFLGGPEAEAAAEAAADPEPEPEPARELEAKPAPVPEPEPEPEPQPA